ncbi:MAG: DUF6077 domain-containing protein [Myxococcota bacterium]
MSTQLHRQLPQRIAVALVCGLGWFQLYFTLVVRLGGSFDAFCWGLVVPVLLAVATTVWIVREPPSTDEPPVDPTDDGWPDPTLLLAVPLVAITAAYALGWIGSTAMAGGAFVVAALQIRSLRAPVPELPDATVRDLVGIAVTTGLGLLAYLWIHRPEGDDVYYLTQAVQTVRHSGLPLLGFDVLHGDLTLPVQQPAHRAQGFETLVSVILRFTGLSGQDAYYFLIPALTVTFTSFATWLVARRWLGPGGARVALLAYVPMLTVWAGHFVAFGNFGYARLFQGKGVFVVLCVPLVLHFALEFSRRPSARTWVALVLAQCAGALATSTGMVVSPMAAAIVVLASLSIDLKGVKLAVGGLLSAAPLVGMLLLVRYDPTAAEASGYTGVTEDIGAVLGTQGRAWFTLAGAVALPTLMRWSRLPGAEWMARYLLVCIALLFHPVLRDFLGEHAGRLMTWRSLWAIPFPLLAAGAVGLMGHLAMSSVRPALRGLGLLGFGIAMVAFTARQPFTFDRENFASLRFAEWKHGEGGGVIASNLLLDLVGPDEVVAVPSVIALTLTIDPERPKILGVRRIYIDHLKHALGEAEVSQRHRIFTFMEQPTPSIPVPWFMNQVEKRCVTGLVLTRAHMQQLQPLRPALVAHGFVDQSSKAKGQLHQYRVWTRPKARCGKGAR